MNCLFCKQKSGGSSSVEHIVPESLGNKRHVLPKGVVCDGCNNYFANKVEAPILNHQSFRNLRAWYQIPSKKGKIPYVQGYARNTDIEVGMKLNKQTNELDFFSLKGNQQSEFERLKRLHTFGIRKNVYEFPMGIKPPQRDMSRFLAKMALEALFQRFLLSSYEAASQLITGAHHDRIRNWARYAKGATQWPFHYRHYFPEETLMKHPDTGEWVQFGFSYDLLLTDHPETFFIFSYHGHEFAINLGGPAIKGYEQWLKQNNHVSFLVEKRGYRIFEDNRGAKSKYYMAPLIVSENAQNI